MHTCLGVIGDPIHHSLSPNMHNRLLQAHHLEAYYHAFHVKRDKLEEAIKGMKALGLIGMNVTIPHKVAIMPYLDVIDPEAKMIGAVNTVVHREGKLYGYNTDGLGFLTSLKEWINDSLDFKRILMVGSGGAARAVALTLAEHLNSVIDITNRTAEKARDLVLELNPKTQGIALALDEAENRMDEYDMVINTTPVGMYPEENHIPISLEKVRPNTRCVDLIYRPLKTQWLKSAEERGCLTMNGVGMLVHQGALAFEHWFNIWPDTKKMAKHLIEDLEERHAE